MTLIDDSVDIKQNHINKYMKTLNKSSTILGLAMLQVSNQGEAVPDVKNDF